MANVFAEKDRSKPRLSRNAFDMSFQNNLTLPFGKIVPIFCKEVLPDDSWDIDCALGLNFMPMVYPVQSKIYVNVHFYYVRNRALWKDWNDFIFKSKDNLVPPYIEQPVDSAFWGTGSLSDYFGVPTDFDVPVEFPPYFNMGYSNVGSASSVRIFSKSATPWQYYNYSSNILETNVSTIQPVIQANHQLIIGGDLPTEAIPLDNYFTNFSPKISSELNWAAMIDTDKIDIITPVPINLNELTLKGSPSLEDVPLFSIRLSPVNTPVLTDKLEGDAHIFPMVLDGNQWVILPEYAINGSYSLGQDVGTPLSLDISTSNIEFRQLQGNIPTDTPVIALVFCDFLATSDNRAFFYRYDSDTEQNVYYGYRPTYGVSHAFVSRTNILSSYNPFGVSRSQPNPVVRISALPFRAYESIYNAYYRNQQNDPFKINGEIEYNKYITNSDGGADSTKYDFFSRYWEPDFLTTAMPSPQQGLAPLVGVNAAGVFTFRNPDTSEEYQAQALIGEDGETLTGIGVHSPDLPQGSLRALMSAVQHGMSINDFRNVNSLQRWLETNLRRGYKYRDLMEAHFGVDIRYNELDMPEFIGGLSTMVDVQKIINNTESSDSSPLGSFAGLGSAFGQFQNRIQKYCDEHGFIIGVMSVTPVPTYTQTIPKHFLKDNALDYFSPEFAKIGMQPIFNREVSPILANYENKLDDVFGYQKAWYDYMSSVDEAHGDFRSSLRDYVMYRRFGSTPELGHDFLMIDMNQVNNVFADTTPTDKILGRILFKCTKKTIIPRHIIPGLE